MNDNAPFSVVGIGASTGGLRALEDFFKSLPANPGMAFVVIPHLAPDNESILAEILARHANLPVQAAGDSQKVEANRVYVLSSNGSLTIAGRAPSLHETGSGRRDSKPIDIFFAALAQDCGDNAVGVILSGSGHDGVLGVKSLKEDGGLARKRRTEADGAEKNGVRRQDRRRRNRRQPFPLSRFQLRGNGLIGATGNSSVAEEGDAVMAREAKRPPGAKP